MKNKKGQYTMTKEQLLKMIRKDLAKWNKTKDGKAFKKWYYKNKKEKTL